MFNENPGEVTTYLDIFIVSSSRTSDSKIGYLSNHPHFRKVPETRSVFQ